MVPRDFPNPINKNLREPKIRRVKDFEEEEGEEVGGKAGHFSLQERVGSMRTKLDMVEQTKEDWEEDRKCEDLKRKWPREFSDIFKEDLGREDRIDIEPIHVDLVNNHQEIHCFKPKTAIEVSPYLEKAAKKELQRMIDAGMLEEIEHNTEPLSRVSLWRRMEMK